MQVVQRVTFVTVLVTATLSLASAQAPLPPAWRAVSAGIDHARITRGQDVAAAAGPWVIHALRVDLTRNRLDAVRATGKAIGLETTSALAARTGAIAAVNGGYFRTGGTFSGDSTGTVQIDGRVLSEPDRARAAVGFRRAGPATQLVFGHVVWDASVTVGNQRRKIDGVNRARGDQQLIVFTPELGATTLTDATGIEVIVRSNRVTEIRDAAGRSAIPSDGFVLSARGAAAAWLRRTARPGVSVRHTMTLRPPTRAARNPWTDAEDILGAGPKLVTHGRVDVTAARERMLPGFATDRHPRTAIATMADGRALLVVVDGRQQASVGMSLVELARTLISLGAREAINLDGGGSTAMVIDGQLANRPSDPTGERLVSDAIIVRSSVPSSPSPRSPHD
ncbi:MAG TPA: phosphodiester glycosidase family protein [Vicinamibacterales bacterium]|nr:phosphodiester glycosidase family protein [Vicinamibacterales bacterium]